MAILILRFDYAKDTGTPQGPAALFELGISLAFLFGGAAHETSENKA